MKEINRLVINELINIKIKHIILNFKFKIRITKRWKTVEPSIQYFKKIITYIIK
jgi:hypothetical protein